MTQATHSLPLPPDTFIGREEELSEVIRRLSDPSCRLLTLAGPGGSGKTRLALEAASRLADSFPDGAHFVPLDTAETEDAFLTRVADVLRLNFRGGREPRVQLLEHLAEMHSLLVLDNFEQLLVAAGLVGDILGAAPRTRLFVTSREALNLREERVFPLPGLRFPSGRPGEDLTEYDSVRLFVERARRVSPGYDPATDWLAISRLCELVQGMPLGIELAASWTRLLSVNDITAEIERSLDFLETSLRNVPDRHRSIRAVFDGSWNLLDDQQREAMARLSVLRAGFDHRAAAAIAGASLPMLSALVDKSLLRHLPDGRHQVHEMLRQYAYERLQDQPEKAREARDAHSEYYSRFLAEGLELFRSGRQVEMASSLEIEMENVRAAWEWAVETRNLEHIRLSVQPMAMFCQLRGRYVQAVARLESAVRGLRDCGESEEAALTLALALVHLGWFQIRLGRLDDAESSLRVCAQIYEQLGRLPPADFATDPALALGVIASVRGQYEEADALGRQALGTTEKTGNLWDRTLAYYVLGRAAFLQGRSEDALHHAQKSYELATTLQHDWFLAYALIELGSARNALGDLDSARRDYQQSYQIREKFGDPEGMAIALSYIGDVALAQKSFTEARKCFERSIALYREIHDKGGLAQSCGGAARAALAFGDVRSAREYFSEALQLAAEIKHVPMLLSLTCDVGDMLLRNGDTADGVALVSLAARHPRSDHPTRVAAERVLADAGFDPEAEAAVADEAALSHATYLLRGALSLPTGIGLAALLGTSAVAGEQADAPKPLPDGLSEREVDVLVLMARGKSNRQIAEELFITPNTVANHVKNILSKTATTNRTEAAAYARDRGLI